MEETLQPLLDSGVPVGLVHDAAEVLELAQLRERGFFTEIEDPRAGHVRVPRTPFHAFVSDFPTRPAPELGEHDAQFGAELAQPISSR